MRALYLAVMGAMESGIVEAVADSLAAPFEAEVRRVALPDPEFALDARRAQYSSTEVLRSLAGQRPADAWKVLGVTTRDLFIPMLTFVFGQAQLNGGTGLISTARLRQEFYGMPPDSALAAVRARKEALHETGHMLGLIHCAERTCAMSLATNIQHLDAKHPGLCGACTALLARRLRTAPGSVEL
jgi:archaemetzincin